MSITREGESAARFTAGQRVQVLNPGPMSTGVIVGDDRNPRDSRLIRVHWDDNTVSWSRRDLLRAVDA